jgi:hypothetical protein
MFETHDVIDLASVKRVIFVDEAVLAQPVCTLGNSLP